MDFGYQYAAMYVRLSENEKLDKTPVRLGDGILKVGEYVGKLGEKKRTAFEMQDGWYLRYKGQFDEVLFFDTNTADESSEHEWHYGFYYIDRNTLLIGGNRGLRDIRINHLEKYKNVDLQTSVKQISLF